MQKVMIIGCPGSGKSTFARALSIKTGLPVFYMDCLFWNEDGTSVSQEKLGERLNEVLLKNEWIIDGTYRRTLRARLDACDKVFLLDFPLEVCLQGIRSRIGTVRVDLPWIEQELDPEFEQYVKDYPSQQLLEIYTILKEYSHIDLTIFKNRDEIADYLDHIETT